MRKAVIAFGVLVALAAAGLVWWMIAVSPLSFDVTQKQFVISKGDGVREIAKKLKDQGIIRDQIAFFLLVKKLNLEMKIQAGIYKLSPSLSAEEVANKLMLGTEDVWVTIPEGWRQEEIVAFLQTKNIIGEVEATIEGKYFPDTYLVPKEITAGDFLKLMQENFSKKVNFPVTKEQLIVASMIEREAKSEADRPLVASVIYNRLKNNMALDVDATVQYALGFWKKDLTIEDLKFKSPYNTYLNPDLPPGPICNPGLSSINAAVNPANTRYYFYLSDKSGVMHYAKTLLEHNQNIAKYLDK